MAGFGEIFQGLQAFSHGEFKRLSNHRSPATFPGCIGPALLNFIVHCVLQIPFEGGGNRKKARPLYLMREEQFPMC